MAQMERDHYKSTIDKHRDAGELDLDDEVDSLTKCHSSIKEERYFVLNCNNLGEFMEGKRITRLQKIAQNMFLLNGQSKPMISDDELHNLSIPKGSITEGERKIMQDHIVVTINMLDKIPFTRKLKNVPLYAGSHHEHLDGSGYPKHLKADEMLLQSCMLCITDFLEALTAEDRLYKKAMPLERAFKILQSEAEAGHLDEKILDFIRDNEVFQRFQKRDEEGDIDLDF